MLSCAFAGGGAEGSGGAKRQWNGPGGGCHRVDQLGPRIHADMRLHVEILLVSPAGLVHLGIARFRFILR